MDQILTELNLMRGPLAAFVLSGLIGWERESRSRSAGLRTHILVGVSAALFIVLGENLVTNFAKQDDQVRFDMIGILGAVVSGVSFLGAGAIFSSKRSEGTKGLTTAASLLAVAAVGMTCGLHLYVLATGVTLLALLTLGPLGRLTDAQKSGGAGTTSDQ
ncbi:MULTISPECIES: MgtC/SapB family protein [Deinococcus]|jgi:putative Mg2+ transporter-C (MgtC) family protein|uniref:Mg2+ transporter-C (MgtC) family protein n=3 Tax=Deinococcus TaxID=1298 RepID=A0ACC6KP81_9DEIO|nr:MULTISPECIES: MgtC/SapB family protein [Deinococcus]MDK2014021.1 MgtC/SapB family protein [Deinococcus sp. 43]MDR6221054.1 putative Mg2+ transporter-C (MgtC) family protein [Deinococcus soli (ex Cha et al. 2016)]MDR6331005.1 putative Mg2+ transporter-C (MgtC) family protein [Deinococcus soli (ex Cha et al. 2016)]MDR6754201.1 putative Mg2+ transporter-C (MgtC) family protein [Deinococcus soli (ex Cha et al. 2016)]GGB83039.1 magnesium transporter [Deinococcus soli (ex Cha et al. 2016)]